MSTFSSTNGKGKDINTLPKTRIRIVPDECSSFDDLYWDTFNREVNPDIPEETMQAQEDAARKDFEENGAWGIAVDILCPACGTYHYFSGVYGMDYAYAHDEANEYRKDLEQEALAEYAARMEKLKSTI